MNGTSSFGLVFLVLGVVVEGFFKKEEKGVFVVGVFFGLGFFSHFFCYGICDWD